MLDRQLGALKAPTMYLDIQSQWPHKPSLHTSSREPLSYLIKRSQYLEILQQALTCTELLDENL